MRFLPVLLCCVSALCRADTARDMAWQQDLDDLSTQLPKLHANLFFQISQADFNHAVSALSADIPNLTDAQVIVRMAAIVALPGDAHTNLSLNQVTSFRRLPLRLRWFQDGLFVTAVGANYPRALGARILQIGNQSIGEAFQTVATVISHENDALLRLQSTNYLINATILQALQIAPDDQAEHLVLQDLAGNQFSMDLPSLDPGTSTAGVFAPDPTSGFTPLNQQHTDQNYWFTYLPDSKTLYFAYNSCMEMANLPFGQFNDQMWAAFDANPVDRFVIDLRNNGGGSDILIQPALDSAAQRATRFNAMERYAIVGRATFSAAIDDSVKLKQAGMTFIGELTGGSVNHYGNVAQIKLPNSQLVVNYSLEYLSFPGYPPGPLVPDIEIPLYAADYFARHDPFLAAALANAAPAASPQLQNPVAVVNAATLRPEVPIAPGSLATLYGSFPAAGDGLQVLVNGIAATLLAATPSQINFQVPSAAGTGILPVAVRTNGATVLAGTTQVSPAGPGIFVADPFNLARPGVIFDEQGNPVTAASPGSILRAYATGLAASGTPQVFFGAIPADVLSSAPDSAVPGLWEITVRVPRNDSVTGEMPLFAVSGATAGNGVTVRILQ